ncbi:hypothetical protein EDC04DRAFT_1138819 [Pisolithus marmoratus]|nr:hypothetical protein EDC04DRAFT_1138819 [Pisolithus marmoratus]
MAYRAFIASFYLSRGGVSTLYMCPPYRADLSRPAYLPVTTAITLPIRIREGSCSTPCVPRRACVSPIILQRQNSRHKISMSHVLTGKRHAYNLRTPTSIDLLERSDFRSFELSGGSSPIDKPLSPASQRKGCQESDRLQAKRQLEPSAACCQI